MDVQYGPAAVAFSKKPARSRSSAGQSSSSQVMTGWICNVLRYKRNWAVASRDERHAQVRGQTLGADAEEGGEFPQVSGRGGVAGRTGLDGGNHEVLRGVFGRDEFKHLCAVARPLEQLGAQCIRDEFRLTLLKNPVAQRIGEHGRRAELGTELLLTTR